MTSTFQQISLSNRSILPTLYPIYPLLSPLNPSAIFSNNSISVPTVNKMMQTEALAKFQHASELLTRNKVTKTNAFENRIMDEIDRLFAEARLKLTEEQWRHFSTVLDTCGRIYGLCVDNIHDEVFKMRGGVSRSADTASLPEIVPVVVQRRLHGHKTLVDSEEDIKYKDLETMLRKDPYFYAMSQRFDSSNAATLLLSGFAVNSELSLVIAHEDPILGCTEVPPRAEVNLENIVTYSVRELREMACCQPLNAVEAKIKGEKSASFELIMDNMDKPLSPEPEWNSEEEREVEEGNGAVSELYQYRDDREEGRWGREDLGLDLMQPRSNPAAEMRQCVEKNVTSKRKKRQRPVVENYEAAPMPVLKIEVDEQGKNLLASVEMEKRKKAKKGSRDSGMKYCAERLMELFTRRVRFVESGFYEQKAGENEVFDDPLNIELVTQVIERNGEENRKERVDLNAGLLKQKIFSILERKEKSTFMETISELSEDLKGEEMEHVSVHTCFVTMLNLANEVGYKLELINPCEFSISKE
jgi:hypothetical protein